MRFLQRSVQPRLLAPAAACLATLAFASCGSGAQPDAKPAGVTQAPPITNAASTTSQTTSSARLPGTGKPPVVIGDKNFTEEFVLGELYYLALKAQGFSVSLDRNIGPTDVTIQALSTGRLALYPEYLQTWDQTVAGYQRSFHNAAAAYQAGQHYALDHGFVLLDPTPFSDTPALAVTVAYASQNHLRTISDLRKLAPSLTLGGPLQFQQGGGALLPVLEHKYGFEPAAFTALALGQQYPLLDQGSIQAAEVNTTDGQLATGDYTLLQDPGNVFGWGNVVPVVSTRALDEEGPAFAATVNRVSALLSSGVIRQLNELVDVAGQAPSAVAAAFLQTHGLLAPSQP